MPKLRMDAPDAAGLRSKTATVRPERAARYAWAKPTMPAPTMATSTSFVVTAFIYGSGPGLSRRRSLCAQGARDFDENGSGGDGVHEPEEAARNGGLGSGRRPVIDLSADGRYLAFP